MPEAINSIETETPLKNVVYISELATAGPAAFPSIIFPGTFDPMHHGHVAAKQQAEHLLGQAVAIVMVENINKPNKTFSVAERVQIIRSYFPTEKIYLALSQTEVQICHQHAQKCIRKKRSEQDTLEFKEICDQYGLDFKKTVEIENIPEVSSLKFKALATAGQQKTPEGISSTAYQLLLHKAGHLPAK